MNKKYRLIFEIFVLFLIFALGAVFVNHFFKPVVLFVILLLAAMPLDSLIRKNIKNSSVRATISILVINVIVVLLAIFIGGFFYNKIMELMKSGAVNALNNIKILLINLEKNIKYEQLITKLYSQLTSLSGIILTRGVSFTSNGLSTYVFANIMLFFTLKDKDFILDKISMVFGKELLEFFGKKMNELRGYFKVQMMLVVVSAVQTSIGFFLLGVDEGLSYGVVCGILDILPIVGILMIFVPLVLMNFYYKRYIMGFGLIALYIYISVSREILQSKFGASFLKIHPLMLFISVYIGFQIQGFTGSIIMLLGSITIKEWIAANGDSNQSYGKL